MAEHDEHPPAEGAVPASREASEPPPEARPAASEGPPPRAETLDYGAPPKSSRFRRWSANGSVRVGAVAIVAGLVGGLVGGGIVAAFSDGGGHDRNGPVRFQREMPGGAPGFRGGPRYWGQLPNGRGLPDRRLPQPATPDTPTPKASG